MSIPRLSHNLIRAALVLLALAGLVGYAGPYHWYADLFTHFRPQYLAASSILLLVLIVWRDLAWLTVACLLCALNAYELLPRGTAPVQSHEPLPDAVRVRCVSLNVLQGNRTPGAVGDFLRSSNADAAVLLEVTPDFEQIFLDLAAIYPGQFIRAKKDSKGAALLTRLPMRSPRFEALPGQSQIGAIAADLETSTGGFTTLGVHSHKPTTANGAASQVRYFQWLAQRCQEISAAGSPVVLMGDLNATPWTRSFREFAATNRLLNTSRGVTFSATWNVWRPDQLIIDHAFVSPRFRLLRRFVGPPVGSDHRPLIVDLALAP